MKEPHLRGFDTAAYERMVCGRKSGILRGRLNAVAYFIEGVEVSEARYSERFPDKNGVPMMNGISVSSWPQTSRAFAVHPKQVKQARDRAKRHGLSVQYKADGTCVIPTRGERQRLGVLEGFRDNDAGYGDYGGGKHKPKEITEADIPDIPLSVTRAN